MMEVLMAMLLMVLPPWLCTTMGADAPEDREVVVVTKVLHADGTEVTAELATVTAETTTDENGNVVVVAHVGGDGGGTRDGRAAVAFAGVEGEVNGNVMFVRAPAPDAAADGRSESGEHKIVLRQLGAPRDPNRGWLGVSLVPVPEALADQLGADDRGVLVHNVAKGSPAELVGLQPHDVIISISGQPVTNDVFGAAEAIRSHKVGDTVNVVVLREGREQAFPVTLGQRPEPEAMSWKFETPVGEVESNVRTHGTMVFRGEDGDWQVRTLGDLGALDNLPDNIRAMIPRSGNRQTQVTVNDGKTTIRTTIEEDGETLSVEQIEDGVITVRRVDAQGQEAVAMYDTAEELAAADEEAHDLYSEANHSMVIRIAPMDGVLDPGTIDIDINTQDGAMFEWHPQMLEGLSEGATFEHAHEHLAQMMEEFHAQQGLPGGVAPRVFRLGKARQTFEAKPDGSIEVKVRKGDSELLQVFRDEADLQQRDPNLYEKYRELIEADPE